MDEDDAFWDLEDIEQLHSPLALRPDHQSHIGDLPSPKEHHHDHLTKSSAMANALSVVASDLLIQRGTGGPKRTENPTINTLREFVAWY
jgi:hypothetical protein